MKKVIFAIYAHPDDEAFGPSGALLMESQAGTEVNLITLTAGEGGMNPDNLPDLKSTRLKEWRSAGQLIGATNMYYLGFSDGHLDNTDMIAVAARVEELVHKALARIESPVEVEFMTSDLNGITGHIDHIVAARAACLAFYRLKAAGLPMSRVRLACRPRKAMPEVNVDWLYIEPGHPESEIDETVDARKHRQAIIEIMRAHHTQRGDGENHITKHGDSLGIYNFIVLS